MSEDHHPNKSFYDRISDSYDALADANEHKARETGESLLAVQPGEAVLEIGFGTGNTLLHLAEAAGDRGRVCGIDVSDGMLEVTEDKLAAAGYDDRVELKVGDAVQLPWPDKTFDAVFMSFTLELFPEDELGKVLVECQRVLKPGGRIAVVSMAIVRPDAGESISMLEKTYIWMHRNFPHIVDCRPIDAVGELRHAAFVVAEEQRMSIWGMPVSAVLATNGEASSAGDFAI